MGGKAKSKQEEIEEVQAPDFATAANILRGSVRPATEQNAKSRGDLSAAWKRIEECRVNKKAAKLAFAVLNMSDELRDDFLRSLWGMMQEMKLGIRQDLVDQMGDGEAPTMPVVAARPAGADGLAALN